MTTAQEKETPSIGITSLQDTAGRCRAGRPESWWQATWTPTPDRKPTRTVRERKSARKPNRSTRASSTMPPESKAIRLVRATYLGLDGAAREMRAAATIAAVAESALTTKCRDEPNKANTIMGKSIV